MTLLHTPCGCGPAPTATPTAYEGLYSRFVAFLNKLSGAQLVSAAALEEATLAVDAPVGEVNFMLGDHLPPAGVLREVPRRSR